MHRGRAPAWRPRQSGEAGRLPGRSIVCDGGDRPRVLQFPNGQLCATDLGSPGSVSATAHFPDGSQQTIEQFPSDTWNALVQAQAQAPSGNGMSALDYVLAHSPSSGSAGGSALLMPGLTGTVVGGAGAINDITAPGTTSHYDPSSGTTGTLVDGNLTNG